MCRLCPAFPPSSRLPLPPFPAPLSLQECSSVGAAGEDAAEGHQVAAPPGCLPAAPDVCVCSGRPSPPSSSECVTFVSRLYKHQQAKALE